MLHPSGVICMHLGGKRSSLFCTKVCDAQCGACMCDSMWLSLRWNKQTAIATSSSACGCGLFRQPLFPFDQPPESAVLCLCACQDCCLCSTECGMVRAQCVMPSTLPVLLAGRPWHAANEPVVSVGCTGALLLKAHACVRY